MAFTDTQTKALKAKLSAKHVKTRQNGGQTLHYIEGWHAIAEANRVFGFDAWDRQTIATKCVWQGILRNFRACSYTATVRIRVRARNLTIVREGSGSGHGTGLTPGEAHERALKQAETDAMKRALVTFGNPFGLALYDKERHGVRQPSSKSRPVKGKKATWTVFASSGEPLSSFSDPMAYCAALRQELESADSAEGAKALWGWNRATITHLRNSLPDLRTEGGQHHVNALSEFYRARLAALSKDAPEPPTAVNAAQVPAQSSRPGLAVKGPRRVRDKDHLRFVANQPCLVCGRAPTQAHHIRFAQVRALSRKPSDEWAVPLCATHHRSLHDAGDEKAWWRDRGFDPISEAKRLWDQTRGVENAEGSLQQKASSQTFD